MDEEVAAVSQEKRSLLVTGTPGPATLSCVWSSILQVPSSGSSRWSSVSGGGTPVGRSVFS
jgi:hypothetical protein